MKYDPSKLEDWDLSDISNCDSNQRFSIEVRLASRVEIDIKLKSVRADIPTKKLIVLGNFKLSLFPKAEEIWNIH